MKNIQPLDKKSIEKIQKHHANLLMPSGALSVVLLYVEQLAGIYAEVPVRTLKRKRVVLFAADHGIAKEGVSAYPQEVTVQMLGSFAQNWAVITALAKNQNLDMTVFDVGVLGEGIVSEKISVQKIAQGTKNFLQENAMSEKELKIAMEIGREVAKETKKRGYDIALIGEMGIGNTTSASAITAALLHLPVQQITGHGTGVSEEIYKRKISIIKQALKARGVILERAKRPIESHNAYEVLRKVGGFEIAAMTGFLLGAAEQRLPVLLDGFITGAAALAAYSIDPMSKEYWIAGHISKEQGHRKILEKLSLRPILDLDLRLGEASGAAFALPVLEQAIAVSQNTGTFTMAGVSNKE